MAHLGDEAPELIVINLTLHGRMRGWRLAEAALARTALARAVVVSGRLPVINPLSRRFGLLVAVLAKPVTAVALGDALASLQPA